MASNAPADTFFSNHALARAALFPGQWFSTLSTVIRSASTMNFPFGFKEFHSSLPLAWSSVSSSEIQARSTSKTRDAGKKTRSRLAVGDIQAGTRITRRPQTCCQERDTDLKRLGFRVRVHPQ